ncbi:MAG: ATP-binding protein [Candidatus Dojkabacteria bacterium]|nr:ATP-binding protein [Candidatus Dojkabacteria bacterium]
MKREELDEDVSEKFLFEGPSGYGKSWLSANIAKIYLIAGKKVLYIDPEKGMDKQKKKIFSNLTDEELDKITLIKATNIDTYLKYMLGWTETKQAGTQTVEFTHGNDYDLKVCDGITTEIEQYKTRLTQKFIKQGYYTIGEKNFSITNKDTFVLPYNFYGKLYDQIKEALVTMLDHNYDIIASMHLLKDTEGQRDLKESIYQKFDTIIKLNKITLSSGNPKWDATILKNRGRESPNSSNYVDDTNKFLKYFIKKFALDYDEVIKRFEYE